ncbi:MAG TPA: hypothetical protein VFQ53_12755 [Kofleriaceae bacterium]|nr:hypothetical protein [Kofleriaceae bacterium]
MGYARTGFEEDEESYRPGSVLYRDPEFLAAMEKRTSIDLSAGSSFELFNGLAAIVMAILGLFDVVPVYMAAFALVAVGFALLAQGSTIANRWTKAVHIPERETTEAVGIGTEVIGGGAGIVIGVLAALGVSPLVLLPSGSIVVGAALLLGGPAQPALAQLQPRKWYVTRDAIRASGGIMVMAGVGGIVLGILALSGGPIITLSLVSMLCVAAALVMAGGALTARLARRFA